MTINIKLADGIKRASEINDQLYKLRENIHAMELAGHLLMAPLAIAFGDKGFRHLAQIPKLGLTLFFNHKKHELIQGIANDLVSRLRMPHPMPKPYFKK